jgi:hypothetical protein
MSLIFLSLKRKKERRERKEGGEGGDALSTTLCGGIKVGRDG